MKLKLLMGITKGIQLCSVCAKTHVYKHWLWTFIYSLQWHHNGRDGVWNHQPYDCLRNRLFRRRSKKTSKPRVTGLCAGKSPVTGDGVIMCSWKYWVESSLSSVSKSPYSIPSLATWEVYINYQKRADVHWWPSFPDIQPWSEVLWLVWIITVLERNMSYIYRQIESLLLKDSKAGLQTI